MLSLYIYEQFTVCLLNICKFIYATYMQTFGMFIWDFFIGLNHINIHRKISINTHFFYNVMYVNAIYVNSVSFIYAG